MHAAVLVVSERMPVSGVDCRLRTQIEKERWGGK